MSDTLDNRDIQESVESDTVLGSKSSSMRLVDENGNLLWSPDDIGIYSEVRTAIISYILENLMKKDGVYLKIEDIHHADGSYTKAEIDSKLSNYFAKEDFDVGGFVEGIAPVSYTHLTLPTILRV